MECARTAAPSMRDGESSQDVRDTAQAITGASANSPLVGADLCAEVEISVEVETVETAEAFGDVVSTLLLVPAGIMTKTMQRADRINKPTMANAAFNLIDDFDLDEYGFRSVRFDCRSMMCQIFYSDLVVLDYPVL